MLMGKMPGTTECLGVRMSLVHRILFLLECTARMTVRNEDVLVRGAWV